MADAGPAHRILTAAENAGIDAGITIARAAFNKRGNHSEIHISEAMLAAMLAVAFGQGVQYQRFEGEQS